MSNEQNGPGIDPLVSDAYKELADETTPEALNREVLRMAARETRTRYAIARAWTRPMAWAATIGLSLVLVLQLADVPEPAATEAPAFERKDADSTGARQKSDEAPEPSATANLPASAPAGRVGEADAQAALPAVAKRSRSEMQQQEQKVTAMNDAPVASTQDAMAETEAPARSYVSSDIVQEVRERARLQEQQVAKEEAVARQRGAALQTDSTGQMAELSSEGMAQVAAERAAVQPMASIAAADEARAFLCPAEARETPEQWLDCISAIEKTSPAELVDKEYEALYERFPDFEQVDR